MNFNEFNRHLVDLCQENGAHLSIATINDPNRPKQEQIGDTLWLNIARIPEDRYEQFARYFVLQYLIPQLVLRTPRLTLRRFCMEDARDCFSFLSDQEGAYMDCCKPHTQIDEEYWERMRLFTEREGQYAIVLTESSQVIGTVNIFEDDSRAVSAMEIGYAISPEFQKQGYAYEALSNLLALFQEDLGLDMVTAGILPENKASHALLKKLGFQSEGIRHKAVWHESLDKPVDLLYYYRDRISY